MGAEHHGHSLIALLLRLYCGSTSRPRPPLALMLASPALPSPRRRKDEEPLPEAVRLAAPEEGDAPAVTAWLDRNWGVNRYGCSPRSVLGQE